MTLKQNLICRTECELTKQLRRPEPWFQCTFDLDLQGVRQHWSPSVTMAALSIAGPWEASDGHVLWYTRRNAIFVAEDLMLAPRWAAKIGRPASHGNG